MLDGIHCIIRSKLFISAGIRLMAAPQSTHQDRYFADIRKSMIISSRSTQRVWEMVQFTPEALGPIWPLKRTIRGILCLSFSAQYLVNGFSIRGTILRGRVSDGAGWARHYHGNHRGSRRRCSSERVISAINTETGARFETVSTATGNYTLPQVAAGVYNLEVTSPGFGKFVSKASAFRLRSPRASMSPCRSVPPASLSWSQRTRPC